MPDKSDERIEIDNVSMKQMKETERVDNHIIASLILGVDVTELYSPECLNDAAKRHGLVPGSRWT